jgi:hypothetical protein
VHYILKVPDEGLTQNLKVSLVFFSQFNPSLSGVHACIFSFFAGSQKKFAVSPAWSKLAHFA